MDMPYADSGHYLHFRWDFDELVFLYTGSKLFQVSTVNIVKAYDTGYGPHIVLQGVGKGVIHVHLSAALSAENLCFYHPDIPFTLLKVYHRMREKAAMPGTRSRTDPSSLQFASACIGLTHCPMIVACGVLLMHVTMTGQ